MIVEEVKLRVMYLAGGDVCQLQRLVFTSSPTSPFTYESLFCFLFLQGDHYIHSYQTMGISYTDTESSINRPHPPSAQRFQ
jgi:hypothetical protein